MSEKSTVRAAEGVQAPDEPVQVAGLLRFAPLGEPPVFMHHCLDRPLIMMGRSDSCEVPVQDDQASRQHCRLRLAGGVWRLTDYNSTNGVFVNGEQVRDQELRGGEIIRIGSALYRFFARSFARQDRTFPAPDADMVMGPASGALRDLIGRAAPSDLSVLVSGETGTGKELVAAALHAMGGNPGGPLVPVNCSAIPSELVESELFGCVKGAYTGATADRPGLIRQASGGTLFLDELGELPAGSQAKLLRVLQERRVHPVGGTAAVAVEIRVVSATNRDLRQEVAAGRFRADLLARVAELEVPLPPLRHRVEDIPLLVRHFLRKHGAGRDLAASPLCLEQLCLQRWPLNIRELESAVRRALLMAGDRRTLRREHFARPDTAPPAESIHLGGAGGRGPAPPPQENPQAEQLKEALRRHRGDTAAAAAELGLSRSQLYRRAKKYGIQISFFRT